MADVEARGLPFTLEMLKSSLALYINRINYVRAVADGCQRIGLDGSPAGEPIEEQRAESPLHPQWHTFLWVIVCFFCGLNAFVCGLLCGM